MAAVAFFLLEFAAGSVLEAGVGAYMDELTGKTYLDAAVTVRDLDAALQKSEERMIGAMKDAITEYGYQDMISDIKNWNYRYQETLRDLKDNPKDTLSTDRFIADLENSTTGILAKLNKMHKLLMDNIYPSFIGKLHGKLTSRSWSDAGCGITWYLLSVLGFMRTQYDAQRCGLFLRLFLANDVNKMAYTTEEERTKKANADALIYQNEFNQKLHEQSKLIWSLMPGLVKKLSTFANGDFGFLWRKCWIIAVADDTSLALRPSSKESGAALTTDKTDDMELKQWRFLSEPGSSAKHISADEGLNAVALGPRFASANSGWNVGIKPFYNWSKFGSQGGAD